MDNIDNDNGFMLKRIQELEDKIEQLRFSRRVLMNLIEKTEKEKWLNLTKLEKENRKLQTNNRKYAKSILNKNRQIMKLEEILSDSSDLKG